MPKLTLFDSRKKYSAKVVIVEDDEADYELALRSFRNAKFENEIIWLDSGNRFIDYILCQGEFENTGHSNPVLVFLDVNMPGLNGKETLDKLSLSHDISDLRVVVLTNADKEHLESINLNQFPYIQKPLDFDKMYEYVMNSKHFLFQ